jgi:ethanolamine ammonia-lyase large subunit
VKSTNVIKAGSVLEKAKQNCAALATLTGKTVLTIITTQVEAQEEADRINIINQSVIGSIEGAVDAITKLVGSNITNAILSTTNGSNNKSVDDFMLFDLMQVAIDGANRPLTNDVLEQFLEVINQTINFRKKISVNMELLQSNKAKMATYGITIGV